MMNVDQINAKLSMMSDAALQQYAAMHKQDPYLLSLAVSESNRRKQVRAAAQAEQEEQPSVADASIAQMRPQPAPAPMPPQQMAAGIPQLAARNIEGMADGGIAGYAKGDRIFSADKYLEDPRVQRFLDYINVYEGSPKENQTVGYHRFDDLSKHPNRRVKFNKRGDKSTAAGAYQLINRTWQDQAKKQGLEDFSLENQKRAAIGVLKETGALDALMQGNIDKAKQRAARAWASIPGSTIGEATGQRARFNPRAEKILADISQPTTVAETKKPAPAPVRAAKRQETVGLSPELAKQITSALPFAAAQAGDLPQDRKTKLKQPEPVQAAKPTPDLRYRDVPGSPDAIEYERQLRAARPPERSYLAQRGRELLGAPEAAASFITGALTPMTGTLYGGVRTLMGTPTTAGEGVEAMTFAPRSEYGKESLSELHRAIEDFKIPAYIPGVGTTASRPKSGKAVSAAEAKRAAAVEARQAAETAKAPRLEAPKVEAPSAGRSVDLRQRFAEAQEQAARAAEAAGDTTKAEALRAGIAKPREFTPSPEAQKFGVEAVLERKRAQQAADVRRAQERAGKAETLADEAMVVAERERALDRGDKTFAEARRQAEARMNTFSPAAIGASVTPGAVSEAEEMGVVPADELGSQDAGFTFTSPQPTAFTPVAEDEDEAAPVAEKKGFGLDNEDMLMLGLGLLSSPGGQAGGELSQLFSNFGRAGLGAVAAKREREKELGERSFKEIMGKYYKKLADIQGRPEMEEREIARVIAENPGMTRLQAIEAIARAKYDPRYDAILAAQREKNRGNPMNMLLGEGGGGAQDFTVLGKRPE